MVTRGFRQMMAEANAAVETVCVDDALALVNDADTVFVDVRDRSEREQHGAVAGAVSAPRQFIEFIADPEGPMHDVVFASGKRLLLYCGSGGRSALAAKTLVDMGFPRVAHIAGGFTAWREAGGAIEP